MHHDVEEMVEVVEGKWSYDYKFCLFQAMHWFGGNNQAQLYKYIQTDLIQSDSHGQVTKYI